MNFSRGRCKKEFVLQLFHLFIRSPLVTIGVISEIKTKKMAFCFVFRSICIIFAVH